MKLTLKKIIFSSSLNTSSTKSNGLKMSRFSKNNRKYSFSLRIIDHWNRLPSEIVNSPNLLSFKTQLARYNIKYLYV